LTKKYADAIRYAEKAIDASPSEALQWAILGTALIGNNQVAEAIPKLEKALDLKPVDSLRKNVEASIAEAKKRLQSAERKAMPGSSATEARTPPPTSKPDELTKNKELGEQQKKERLERDVAIKMLEFEALSRQKMAKREIILQFDMDIDDIDRVFSTLNVQASYTSDEEPFLKQKAKEVIKLIDNPCLLEILRKFDVSILAAKKIGKFLLDNQIIDSFPNTTSNAASPTTTIVQKPSMQPAIQKPSVQPAIQKPSVQPAFQKPSMGSIPPFIPYNGGKPFVFACFSPNDREKVYPIIDKLYQKGVRIWYGDATSNTEAGRKNAADKIGSCTVFLVFLTPSAIIQKDTLAEIMMAERRLSRGDFKILPVYLEDFTLPTALQHIFSRIPAIMKSIFHEEALIRKLIALLEGKVIEAVNP
jgi:hypothetical protein